MQGSGEGEALFLRRCHSSSKAIIPNAVLAELSVYDVMHLVNAQEAVRARRRTAGATATMGFSGSFSMGVGLSDKLSASQYSLGKTQPILQF